MNWRKQHGFALRLAALLLIVLPPIAMYPAAQIGAAAWIVLLVGLVALGCALAMLAN